MKKVLLTLTLLLTLSMGLQAAGQKHRHTPQHSQELVDSTDQGGIEVYSDTKCRYCHGEEAGHRYHPYIALEHDIYDIRC